MPVWERIGRRVSRAIEWLLSPLRCPRTLHHIRPLYDISFELGGLVAKGQWRGPLHRCCRWRWHKGEHDYRRWRDDAPARWEVSN